jgi:hypothetical protein
MLLPLIQLCTVLQVCDAVMQLRAHKSRLVRVTVTSLLPQLVSVAHYSINPDNAAL